MRDSLFYIFGAETPDEPRTLKSATVYSTRWKAGGEGGCALEFNKPIAVSVPVLPFYVEYNGRRSVLSH